VVSRPGRSTLRRLGLGALSLGIVVATFAFVLPTIADYRDVWALVQDLSWEWIALLFAAALLNLLTFAPPWMVVLPGLSFAQAITVTQASTALSIVVPGGLAAGLAGSYAMLRRWGFASRDVARAVTLTGLWNQFLNLSFPIVAVFLLNSEGGDTKLLGVAAFVGVAVLGVAVAALAVVLVSKRLARDVGELMASVADWVLARIRRGPVSWGGPSFERFRLSAGDLLRRRWHLLTAASLAGSLTVFAVLVVALRAFDVPASEVSLAEAFAAWSFIRIIGTIPITPGGIGIVEVGLTSALIGFGGANAGVVAAVLVYRFLTIVPTLLVGLVSAATWRRHRLPDPDPVPADAPLPPFTPSG
jgi:putative heme transporter